MQHSTSGEIDQAVHGYNRGHKQLVCTVELDDISRSKMLVLSDLLTEATLQHGESYLTGYPLRSASRYVLARTWPAGPDFRPGSVWTHSLIVDFQTIALTPDLSALASLFRMPTPSTLAEFAHPLKFNRDSLSDLYGENSPRAAVALLQLYGDLAKRTISVPAVDSIHDENLALAIWRQMWPALRREFAFTTSVSAADTEFEAECFLRFLDFGYEDFSASGVTWENISAGHRALLDDLTQNNKTKLRTFLARYVIESPRPRNITARMAAVFQDMQNARTSMLLSDVAQLLKEEKLPRLSKDILINAVDSIRTLSDLLLLLESFGEDMADVSLYGIATVLDSISETDLRELLNTTQPSKKGTFADRVFREVVQFESQLLLARAADTLTRKKLYLLRPELIENYEFWPLGDQERVDLIESLGTKFGCDLEMGIALFGNSLGPKTLSKLLAATQCLTSNSAASLLVSKNKKVREIFTSWLSEHDRQLEQLISNLNSPSIELFEAVSKIFVDTMQPVGNMKAWLKLVAPGKNLEITMKTPAALVVTYATAVHFRGADSLAAGRCVYDQLQSSVRNMTLGYGAERYLKTSLSPFGYAWSLSALITKAAVKKWPISKGNIGALFLSSEPMYLLDIAAEIKQTQGRRLLEDTLKDQALSAEAHACIKRFIEKDEKKSLLDWWR
ncbi:hypothetical protein [Herbaspirillum huttiense]|uniref:GAP1-N1 domain-containing protein n=1 Tax=Herbaspirillum huttiense TaxID=863372 RepID=UPI0031D407AF